MGVFKNQHWFRLWFLVSPLCVFIHFQNQQPSFVMHLYATRQRRSRVNNKCSQAEVTLFCMSLDPCFLDTLLASSIPFYPNKQFAVNIISIFVFYWIVDKWRNMTNYYFITACNIWNWSQKHWNTISCIITQYILGIILQHVTFSCF